MSAARKEKKKNKKQPTSSNTEANSSKLWPDLPKKLIYLIERQPSLCQAIFSRGVTKSWKIKPNKCNSNSTLPWLQLAIDDHEIANNYNKQPHTFNITFKRDCIWYWYRDSRPPEKLHVLGCSHGIIVSKQVPNYFNPAPNYVLRDATDDGGWYLPLWDIKHPLIYTSSSSKPSYQNKCVVIVLTGITSPAFAFYRMWGETREWMKKDSAIVDPRCSDPNGRSNLLRFTNGIWFKEKLFALSLQGTLAVIEEDIDSDVRITTLSKKRAVPSVSSMHFRECLIESEGKVLLVFLISRNSIKIVDYVEVYQLNTTKLTWIKKESIGDVTLFLGTNCCMSVSASRVGCRRNCICFTSKINDGWWIYDMQTGTISHGWSDSAIWIEEALLE